MSLHHFQTALGRLVRARAADGEPQSLLRDLAMAEDEQCAVATLLGGRGLEFTREVQRSWCKGRARNAAYLTLSLLAEDERQALLEQWVEAGGGIASFFAGEAEAFLDFLALHLHDRPHALAICRMEQAVHRANAAQAQASHTALAEDLRQAVLMRTHGASLVEFHAEPEALLAAVRTGTELPPVQDASVPLLFGPELSGLFERADADEAALWHRLETPARWRELEDEGVVPAVAERLISLGIVCPLLA